MLAVILVDPIGGGEDNLDSYVNTPKCHSSLDTSVMHRVISFNINTTPEEFTARAKGEAMENENAEAADCDEDGISSK
jgi:ribose 1,5-bisphosphokinase PhnN